MAFSGSEVLEPALSPSPSDCGKGKGGLSSSGVVGVKSCSTAKSFDEGGTSEPSFIAAISDVGGAWFKYSAGSSTIGAGRSVALSELGISARGVGCTSNADKSTVSHGSADAVGIGGSTMGLDDSAASSTGPWIGSLECARSSSWRIDVAVVGNNGKIGAAGAKMACDAAGRANSKF